MQKPSAGRKKAGWEIRSQLFLRILKLQSCSLVAQRREPRHERWLCRLQSQPALSTWMLRTSCSVLHSLPKTNVHIAGSACASKGAAALVACVSVAFFSEKLKKTTLSSTCCHRLWGCNCEQRDRKWGGDGGRRLSNMQIVYTDNYSKKLPRKFKSIREINSAALPVGNAQNRRRSLLKGGQGGVGRGRGRGFRGIDR